MLLHHDKRSYDEAASRAKDWAIDKLNALIARGRETTQATLEEVDRTIIDDAVVPASGIRFEPTPMGTIQMRTREHELDIHTHALGQVMGRLGGTKRVMDWAYDRETADEFASILNKKMHRQTGKRYLARSVGGELRGFMSDRYRRLDVRPMVEALVTTAVNDHGAVPIDAKALDTSFHMKMVLPTLYEPIPNEVGVFGLTFRNSDFGAGRLYIKGFFNRLWCTNLAMCEDGISQIHLGRALSDDISFSDRTYELDTMTMASAIQDVVKHVFSVENITMRLLAVKEAHESNDTTDVGKVLKGMVKNSKLLKGEAQQVTDAFNSADVEMLPPGQNRWRLSNAISLIAQDAEADRQLELETLAGEVAGLVR